MTFDQIETCYSCGIRDFGESKVNVFLDKYLYFPDDINWHFIGHLQTNKIIKVIDKVSLIHSVDSIRLLDEIQRQSEKKNLTSNVLIQINIGKEISKYGIFEEEIHNILLYVKEKCCNIDIKGLMTIIPKCDKIEQSKYFSSMKKIFNEVVKYNCKNIHIELLSMGMSNDYESALAEGANVVRIGQGLIK